MSGSEQPRRPAADPAANRSVTFEVKAHKLFPPPDRPGAVTRRAILDRALRLGPVRVTLFQAPAGSGKSTALQQVQAAFAAQRWATAWLAFDDADNDPQRFESHLRAMLEAAGKRTGGDGEPALRAPGVALVDWMLEELGRFGSPVAMFFDDFQVLRDAELLQFFRALLRQLPGRSRVFIGSRSLPDVGLASLLVSGQASVLRAEDLRFSAAESNEFFAGDGAPATSESEIEFIHQRTEGWPAGLQLFRLALSNPAVRGSLDELAGHGPRELAEYLSENVVSTQPPDVRQFLLRTSLLRRLTGPLCDAVVGRSGSQELLRRLERSGLFLLPLDASGVWFRYHGLFASFLSDSLHRDDPGAAAEVHGLAARWHHAHGSLEEAVHHAVQAGDIGLAIEALNAWASQLIASAELVTMERWYARLPLEEVARRPDLAIKVAWSLTFLRRNATLRPLLAQLTQQRGCGEVANTTNPDVVLAMAALFQDDVPAAAAIADKAEVYRPTTEGFASFELGAAANLIAFHALGRGDFESARRMLLLAHSHNERAGAAAFSQGYTAAVTGISHIMNARPREALRNLGAGAARPTGAMASAAVAACQIWAAYESDSLDSVARLAEQFGAEIAQAAVPDFIVVALTAISRMHDARGRPEAAQAALEALDRIGFDSGWPRIVQVVEWERVRRALMAGSPDRARAIAQRIGKPAPTGEQGWLPVSELLDGHVLGALRLAIHQGEWSMASRLLGQAHAMRPERPLLRIKLLVLEAIMLAARGDAVHAQRAFLRALEAAAPGQCARAILDEGPRALPLLAQAWSSLAAADGSAPTPHAEMRDFAVRLLRASGVEPADAAPAAIAAPSEPLSERERDILRLLCAGASNRDMAQQLAVSENTVKFHLKNLYGKLGVGSRAQAIRAAGTLQRP